MSLDIKSLTILHIEDNPRLAESVMVAFRHFGFRGDIIGASSVSEAINLLNERERNKKPLSLIITDIQLPDGTGLDVIRQVKTDPAWRMTPVIVLTNKDNESIVNEAYALGANCYMPKVPESKSLWESLQSFYQNWLENAKLPRARSRDRLQDTLERAIGLKTRTSEFYLCLARASEKESGEMKFWLDCALNEGNLANLLAFFRNKLSERDVPKRTIDQLAGMQMKITNSLKIVEGLLVKNPSPRPSIACKWAIELANIMDEDVFAEAFGHLFPKSPVATSALKTRAAIQMKELALHVLDRVEDAELRKKAASVFAWSRRLSPDD